MSVLCRPEVGSGLDSDNNIMSLVLSGSLLLFVITLFLFPFHVSLVFAKDIGFAWK